MSYLMAAAAVVVLGLTASARRRSVGETPTRWRVPTSFRPLAAAVIGMALTCLGVQTSQAGLVGPGWGADSQGGSIGDPRITYLPNGEIVIDPVVTITGMATGTAAAGTYDSGGGVMKPTPPDDLADAKTHASEYDGKTIFTADYTIVLKPDGTVDNSKSTVTFVTKKYTAEGKLVGSTFTTQPITITSVMLSKDKPPKVITFMFNSTAWYPAADATAAGIANNGLSGSINLVTGASSYTASYIDKSNGAVYTYDVKGMITPAPATWIMMLTGFVGLVHHRRKRDRQTRSPTED